MQQQFWNIYLHRAHFPARATQTRRIGQLCRLTQSDQLRSNDCSDWARVDRPVSVSTNLLINRAGIEACAATNTSQRLTRNRMREHPRAPVIEQDEVQLLWAFVCLLALCARD